MAVPLITARTEWYCPACGATDVTTEARHHVRYHVCPRLRFLTAPMLPKGTAAKVELHEREDYVGTEAVQLDPEQGRPVFKIVTTRDDGEDCMVFAPTAVATVS